MNTNLQLNVKEKNISMQVCYLFIKALDNMIKVVARVLARPIEIILVSPVLS